MSNLENWDSMGHLMLILELEQTFETGFEPEEVEKMTSVSAIVAALESKGVSE
jgi:acyl carrier protein